MSKKILSIVLALALALSCFAVSAFAAGSIAYESDEDAALYKQEWALESSNSGNVYTVKVLLTANYDVGPIQFKVNKTVDKGTITLKNAVRGDAIPAEWNADVSFSDTTGKVAVIPNPEEKAAYGIANPDKACVAILTYEVSDAAAAGSLVIDVADAKSAAKPNGTLIAARMDDKNVVTSTAYTGQTVSEETNTVPIGSASVAPTLAVIDGTIGVIDTSRTVLDETAGTECDGYVYGIEPFNFETVDAVFEVVGDGTLNVEANAYGSTEGTGAMVQVLDAAGEVVAEYVLVVFGDVDGDGAVTTLDASEVELHAGYAYPDSYGMGRFETAYTAFAACVDGCGDASTLDASEIELSAGYAYPDAEGNGYLSQAAIISLL